MKRAKEPGIGRELFSLFLSLLALFALLFAVGNVKGASAEEGQRQLERSLYRATVSCYAYEGQYPPNLAYLEEHYGVVVDETRYRVFYEVFGDNLMPDITVLPN